jgi:tyrosine aminotransferase
MGANTIVQGALQSILEDTPESFHRETISTIETNARLAFEMLSVIPGLKPVMPDVSVTLFTKYLRNLLCFIPDS